MAEINRSKSKNIYQLVGVIERIASGVASGYRPRAKGFTGLCAAITP